MQERGYADVGVSDICVAAGVNKGSFYHFFRSKETLGVAAIDRHWEESRVRWESALGGRARPLRRLTRLLDAFYSVHKEWKEARGFTCGCMLGNLALERSAQDPAIRARLQMIFAEQEAMLRAVLEEASEAGELAPGLTPARAARAVLAQIEGMVMLAKVRDEPKILRDLSAHALRLVT